MGAIFGFLIIWFAIAIALFVFWLRMLIAAAKHEFEHKTMWIILIVLGNIIGATAFYFAVYREKIKPHLTNTVMHQ